jgi:hypothetical protein
MNQDKPEATLNITKFGNFTANFKVPPPPDIYMVTLFTVVATALFGSWTFIGSTVTQRRKAKEQGSKLDYFHNEIKKVYDGGKLLELDNLRDDITDEYMRGKITKEQYDKLGPDINKLWGDFDKRSRFVE